MSLTAEENELMCRVNPGSPMGDMLSEYWWPVLRSEKLVADGAPARVRLLGRDFVAFRATDDRVGLLDEGCPHRHVSLALARNENCGLRCVMHAWKIDVDGNVVDTPNEFGFSRPERIKTHSYPVREAGGMVWVYVGEGEPSPFPELPFTECEPGVSTLPVMATFNCNWVQLLETLWDPAHVNILHGTGETLDEAWGEVDTTARGWKRESADSPTAIGDCETKPLPYGFLFTFGRGGAIMEAMGIKWCPTVMPSWVFIGAQGGTPESDRLVFGHVPVDDETTILWQIPYNPVQPLGDIGHAQVQSVADPNEWRPAGMDRESNWGQDRDAMASGSYSGIGEGGGITGLLMQDVAVAESMGALVDRSFETLGPADRAIVVGRRMLLDAVRAHMNGEKAFGAYEDVSNVGRPGGAEVTELTAAEAAAELSNA